MITTVMLHEIKGKQVEIVYPNLEHYVNMVEKEYQVDDGDEAVNRKGTLITFDNTNRNLFVSETPREIIGMIEYEQGRRMDDMRGRCV